MGILNHKGVGSPPPVVQYLYATGQNSSGQLGLSDVDHRYYFTKVEHDLPGEIESIASTLNRTFFLMKDKRVFATKRGDERVTGESYFVEVPHLSALKLKRMIAVGDPIAPYYLMVTALNGDSYTVSGYSIQESGMSLLPYTDVVSTNIGDAKFYLTESGDLYTYYYGTLEMHLTDIDAAGYVYRESGLVLKGDTLYKVDNKVLSELTDYNPCQAIFRTPGNRTIVIEEDGSIHLIFPNFTVDESDVASSYSPISGVTPADPNASFPGFFCFIEGSLHAVIRGNPDKYGTFGVGEDAVAGVYEVSTPAGVKKVFPSNWCQRSSFILGYF